MTLRSARKLRKCIFCLGKNASNALVVPEFASLGAVQELTQSKNRSRLRGGGDGR